MKNTTKGLFAGAAGLALVLGGATFALWSDTALLPDRNTIAAGNLDVAVSGQSWYDVSPDRSDNPHPINLGTFNMVPRDEIQRDYKVRVALKGDNMVAQLRLVSDGQPLKGRLKDALDVSYEVIDANGTTLITDASGDVFVTLGAEDNENKAATTISVDGSMEGEADFTVRVKVTFKDVSEQRFADVHAHLADAQLELKQVRHGEAGFDSSQPN